MTFPRSYTKWLGPRLEPGPPPANVPVIGRQTQRSQRIPALSTDRGLRTHWNLVRGTWGSLRKRGSEVALPLEASQLEELVNLEAGLGVEGKPSSGAFSGLRPLSVPCHSLRVPCF